jgi:UDP-N-acetylglucosamine--dolichyl-phosphate N-acetylglucosaminephosphotransferase
VAESAGVIVGGTYLMFMFLFIPFPFANWYYASNGEGDQTQSFPHSKYSEFIAALLRYGCRM